mmetsp:Transcript_27607/g.30969  ORF Transcript_27607/g.30969 Transcript_27607/m.30969 type:complete len:98 (-) Transcript_27607:47-340(-)
MILPIRSTLSFDESLPEKIRARLPCHNPPPPVVVHDTTTTTTATTTGAHNNNTHHRIRILHDDQPNNNKEQRKQPLAYNQNVPEPFTDGFPFSDIVY